MIKALAGGGGRGMWPVYRTEDIEAAYARCCAEALQAFGDGRVYVERVLPRARHVEVQVAGDRSGGVSHFWERECTLQRRRQKLIEMAPAPGTSARLRQQLVEAAVALAGAARLDNLATVEFLVAAWGGECPFACVAVQATLRVEHPATTDV